MNLGTLTATLGVDAQGAINSMTHFERTMITLVNKIDSTLERMEASMGKVGSSANAMSNTTVAGLNKITAAAKTANNALLPKWKGSEYGITKAQMGNALSERLSKEELAKTIPGGKMTDVNNAIGQRLALEKIYIAQTKHTARMIGLANKEADGMMVVYKNQIAKEVAEKQKAIEKIYAAQTKRTQKMIAEANKEADGMMKAYTKTAAANKFSIDSVTSTLNNASQKFRTFGYLASATITLPMVMAGKAAFNMAKDYEFSIQKIVGLTGVAQSTVNAWSDQILKLGPALGKSPQELADALYFIASSGIKGAEAMNVLELSAKAAVSGLGDTKDVADILTSALNAYAGSGKTAAYYTDVLVAAVRVGKAEASSFATAMGQLIPFASEAGVSFDQMAGGMAAITLTGSSAASAAVYLKGVFNTLITANKQGEKALNSVGLSYASLRKTLATGPEGLINVMRKFREVQLALGDEAVKDVLPNIRAMTAFMSIAGKNFQYNTQIMKEVTNATGSLSAALAAVSDTIKIRYDRAISQSNVSMIALGKSIATTFLPILENLVGKLDRLTKWFESLTEEQKRHKLMMLAWVAAAGPISLIISVVGYAISGLIAVLSGLWATLKYGRLIVLAWAGSMEAAAAATTMNATLTVGLLSTLGPIILAVGALAGAYFLLKARIEAATDAGESFKKAQETGKYIQSTEKEFQDKVTLIPEMDQNQLNAFRDAANQKLVILKEERLNIVNLRKKWQEEDKTYLRLKEKLDFAYAAYDKWMAKPEGINRNATVNEFARSYNEISREMTKYEDSYNQGLDKSANTLNRKIADVMSVIWNINDTIKNLPVDPILAQMEQELRVAEALQVRNTEITKIVQSVQDELKYTDSLATIMNKLGLEYNATGAKADIFLTAIQNLLKQGLGPNSVEVQAQVKNLQDLKKAYMDANPAIQGVGTKQIKPQVGQGFGKWNPGGTQPGLQGIGMEQAGQWVTSPAAMDEYIAQVQRAMAEAQHLTDVMAYQRIVVGTLQNGFELLFEGGKDGFKNMVDSMIKGFERLMAKVLALIAAYIILDILSGGGTALAGFAKSVKGTGGMGDFIKTGFGFGRGMANGGTVPPGFPNDSYPARLTSGETVLPKALNGAAYGNNNEPKEVLIRFQNGSLEGYMDYQRRKTNSFA